ncbi:MAG: arginase family protein, partial [Pyrinomonadaceae bacterium]
MATQSTTENLAESATGLAPGKPVRIVGVPLAYGASMAGVDMGPAALRVARLHERIAQLGYQVTDAGDLRVDRPKSRPKPDDKAKYLNEITAACEQLAVEVHETLSAGELPIILGGDHSIAIGSIAGVAAY